jgi:hypothetical protein
MPEVSPEKENSWLGGSLQTIGNKRGRILLEQCG